MNNNSNATNTNNTNTNNTATSVTTAAVTATAAGTAGAGGLILVSVIAKLIAGALSILLGFAILKFAGPQLMQFVGGIAQEAAMSPEQKALAEAGEYDPSSDVIVNGDVYDKNDITGIAQAQRDALTAMGYKDVQAEREKYAPMYDEVYQKLGEVNQFMEDIRSGF